MIVWKISFCYIVDMLAFIFKFRIGHHVSEKYYSKNKLEIGMCVYIYVLIYMGFQNWAES